MDQSNAGRFRSLLGKKPGRALFRVTLLLAAFYALIHYVWSPILVDGISMTPTYNDGDITFVNRLAYRKSAPQRGDVVAIDTGEEILLKRIIALPGEQWAIHRGIVFVNGKPLHEPYVKNRFAWETPIVQLGTNQYLVIGDNRGMPQHQHYFGITQRKNILGKIMF